MSDTGRIRYLFFWGHAPDRRGRVTASCLSQWWPAPFVVDGVEYATAEHWMMAAKARLFGDAEAERRAVGAPNPALAKTAGRLVRGFDEALWARERLGVVTEGSVHKFRQHPALRDFLLGTGDRVLVEASPLDRVWGIGLAADDDRAQDPATWRGLNLLGEALMAARERLRDDAEDERLAAEAVRALAEEGDGPTYSMAEILADLGEGGGRDRGGA